MTETHTTTEQVLDEHAVVAESSAAYAEAPHAEGEEKHYTHETTMYAEPLLHVGPFTITNSLLTGWIAVLVIIVISVALRLSLKRIPGKFQAVFESLIEGALSVGDQITGNRKVTNKIFPISISIFFFVMINNWLGIMPFMSLGIIHHETTFIPFLRGATADLNTTIAISVIAVIGANIFGAFSIGAWKMFNKYFNVKVLIKAVKKVRKDPVQLLVAPITFAVGLLEIVGEGARVASLSLRLFGNIFAGEVLLASMGAIMAYAVPIPFLFLEIFVGMIQAFIFAVLTTVYFTIAAQDHDHDEEHDHGHEGEHGAHVLDEIPADAEEEKMAHA